MLVLKLLLLLILNKLCVFKTAMCIPASLSSVVLNQPLGTFKYTTISLCACPSIACMIFSPIG